MRIAGERDGQQHGEQDGPGSGGPQAARVPFQRAGSYFDPQVAEAYLDLADGLWSPGDDLIPTACGHPVMTPSPSPRCSRVTRGPRSMSGPTTSA